MDDTAEISRILDGHSLDPTGAELYRSGVRYKQIFDTMRPCPERTKVSRSLYAVICRLHQRYPTRSRSSWRDTIVFAAAAGEDSLWATAPI